MDLGEKKIKRFLCDSGEQEMNAEKNGARTIGDVNEIAASMMDHAYLNNVVVVETEDGKHYVGEFSFDFREVDEAEAKRVAEAFGDPHVA